MSVLPDVLPEGEGRVSNAEDRACLQSLTRKIGGLRKVLVAFSGGVDSTFLLTVCCRLLGTEVFAVMADSPLCPSEERERARRFLETEAVPHRIVPLSLLGDRAFLENPPDRCYFCKRRIFLEFRKIGNNLGIRHILHGEQADDVGEERPGARAAKELGVLAPLRDVGLTKAAIRRLSRDLGLPTWDIPSMACLATRIPHGEPITAERLTRVDAAEAFLRRRGFSPCRVRDHRGLARIELDPCRIAEAEEPVTRDTLVRHLLGLGFLDVTVDLEGYGARRSIREPGPSRICPPRRSGVLHE